MIAEIAKDYAGMAAVAIRNKIKDESRLDVLRALALDPRQNVGPIAQRRLARLGASLGDGGLDNTGTYEGPITPDGFALDAVADTVVPLDDVPLLETKPESKRRRSSRRRNLPPRSEAEPSAVPAAEPTRGGEEDRATGPSSPGDEQEPVGACSPAVGSLGEHAAEPAQSSPSPGGATPSEAPARKVKVQLRKRSEPSEEFLSEWEGKSKVCPKCHKRKDIVDEFGHRVVAGTKAHPGDRQIPQPWCHACRKESSREHAARKKAAKAAA